MLIQRHSDRSILRRSGICRCIPFENFSVNDLNEILAFNGTSNDLDTLVNTLLTLIKSGHKHPWGHAFESISGIMDNNQDQRENKSPIKKLNYVAEADSWAEDGDFDSSEMKLEDEQFEKPFPKRLDS